MKSYIKIVVLVAVIATLLLMVVPVLAQDDATYEDLLAMYGDWTQADAEAAGYTPAPPVCVDAATEGLPAELGAMGIHAVNPELISDGVVQATKPDIILLDTEGKVIGVEYEIDSVVENPPTIDGHPLVFTPPHPGVEHEHMSLHVYFVGDEANRFGTWNPAVACPSAEMAPEALPVSGADQSAGKSLILTLGLVGLGLVLIGGGYLLTRRVRPLA
jgi:hypothetical protein